MALPQRRLLFHEHIDLHTDTITRMVALETLETLDEGREAVCHIHHLAFHTVTGLLTGQTGDVLKASASPVVDDEKRKASCAEGIEPPDTDVASNEREQEGERVEDDV